MTVNLDKFVLGAAGREACVGVHGATPAPLVPPSGVELRTVDGALTSNIESIFDAFAEVWHFPPWFGRNPYAFDDFMQDLPRIVQVATGRPPARAYLTDITNAHLLLAEQPEVFPWFVDRLSGYCDYYHDEADPPAAFGLLLSAPIDRLDQVLERWLAFGVEVARVDAWGVQGPTTLSDGEPSGERIAYLRQLALDSLNNYSGGFAALERVDRDLKSIIRSLEEVADPSWAGSLLRQWGELEIKYALALDDGRRYLTQDEETDVQGIVTELVAEFQRYEPPPALDP